MSRKVWVSILLLMVSFLALTPTSLLPAIYAGATTTFFTPMPGLTFKGIITSSSKTLHTTIIGITMPTGLHSLYIFQYEATLNAPPAPAGFIFPGTVDAGKCSNTASCVITIDEGEGNTVNGYTGCAEYCNQATITISVNFPSSEHGEPVTLTVPKIPAGVQLSWGNELPASSLASYTATPPFTVNLGIYVTATELNGTPLYGSPISHLDTFLYGNPLPPAVISIVGQSYNSFPHTLATITLTVNPQLPTYKPCVVFGTNPDTNPNFSTDCAYTYTYP